MKEKINTFKKLWAIPRYKAIIKLILFGIFFLSLYIIMQIMIILSNPSDNKPVKIKVIENVSATDNFKNMSSYEYTYEINYILNNQNLSKLITGTKYNNKNVFKILNNKYSISNDLIYDSNNNVVTNLCEYDLINLLPNNLVNLFVGEKTETKYSDGKVKIEYDKITIYEENNYITKIELDLTDEVSKINNKITYYSIIITYSNINNISSFD